MDHIIAARLDGMLMAVRAELDGVAHFMKEDLSEEEYTELILSIGRAMAELIDISTALHERFPDILPKQLRPDE